MRSAKENLKDLFIRDCKTIKTIHTRKPEFKYLFSEIDGSGNDLILNPLKSNTGGLGESGIEFYVANQNDFEKIVQSGKYFKSEINDVFKSIMSEEIVLSTLDDSDREKIATLKRISAELASLELTEMDTCKTLDSLRDNVFDFAKVRGRYHNQDGTYNYDDFNFRNNRLGNDLKNILGREHSYTIKSFRVFGNKIDIDILFKYRSSNEFLYNYSKTPINVVIDIYDFCSDKFILELSKTVNHIIKNVDEYFPEGSPELALALESHDKELSLGAFKKSFDTHTISVF